MTKVALVGTVPASRLLAPYDDREWKIWACSPGNANGVLPRIDTFFELHAICELVGAEHKGWAVPFLGWLRSQEFSVYMQEKNDLVPQALVFPAKDLMAKFGTGWFTSSIAWMMAFAISQMREGDTIGLFGIDMAAGQEHYTAQKAGCHYFIEKAKERGINVTIPMESCLAQKPPMYGYSEATPMGRRLNVRLNEMKQLQAALEAGIQKQVNELNYIKGAIEQCEYMIRTFTDGSDFEAGNVPEVEQNGAPNVNSFAPRASGVLVPIDTMRAIHDGKS